MCTLQNKLTDSNIKKKDSVVKPLTSVGKQCNYIKANQM